MQGSIAEWEKKYVSQLVMPVDWLYKLPQNLLDELIDANPDVINRALKEYFDA